MGPGYLIPKVAPGEHTQALQILLIRAGIEPNPGPLDEPIACAICSSNKWNTAGIWCGRGGWVHVKCTNLTSDRQWSPSFDCHRCSWCIKVESLFQEPKATPTAIKVLQFNCNGLRSKLDNMLDWMEQRSIAIAAIQETNIPDKTMLKSPPGYSIVQENRPACKGKGGGLAFIIKNTVNYSILNTTNDDKHLEVQGIKVTLGETNINIINTYIPPSSSCDSNYTASISNLLKLEDSIIVGDFNAHHSLWHSKLQADTRGNIIANEIDDSNQVVLNEKLDTRITKTCESSPDISLASPSIAMNIDWHTEQALGSDHLPIILTLNCEHTPSYSTRQTFINFRKADWQSFKEDLDLKLTYAKWPTNVYHAEKLFRKAITKAAARHIPQGRIKEVIANFPSDAAKLSKERDELQKEHPGDPRITELNYTINKKVIEHKRAKWTEFVKGMTHKGNSSKLWNAVKSLSSNNPKPPANRGIFFDAEKKIPYHDPKKCANKFNQQYTPHPKHSNKSKRNTLRKIRELKMEYREFTEKMVDNAIRDSKKSKALGPDKIAPIHLHHIGPIALTYLTELINRSVRSANIPNIWKIGRVIPLHKPGKPADEAKSFRPIALLSPIAKIIEKLLLNDFWNFPLKEHQHGFRPQRSTTTALNVITHNIKEGLNKAKPCHRTLLVALDLTAAFDTVDHGILLRDIYEAPIPNSTKRWVASYLQGRFSYVEYKNKKSKLRKVKQGVPQGGVLSPMLFNMYMSKMPLPEGDVHLVTYADDITLTTSNPQVNKLKDQMEPYLKKLNIWLKGRFLKLSAEKSIATIFTTWSKEVKFDPKLEIDGMPIPTKTKSKILGVTLDSMLTYGEHTKITKEKSQKRNNILRKIAGNDWGCTKETLGVTYKAIGKSVINYGAPIWAPTLSDTNWKHLQTQQNNALRTITGCVKMTNISDLHNEGKVLPVKAHNEMLAKQFLVGSYQSHRADHYTTKHVSERPMKPTLKDKYGEEVCELINDEVLDRKEYKKAIIKIHTRSVRDNLLNNTSKVLGTKPPVISADEQSLPRLARTKLAQLRTGYSTLLNSYRSRISPEVKDSCPDCGRGPHDLHHLFNCEKNPTDLEILDLWLKPKEVAEWLGLTEPTK